jgi:UV DNA damage repair endonuclease
MLRFGLCCIFRDQPIKFTGTTGAALGRMNPHDARAKLGRLCAANAEALLASLRFWDREPLFHVSSPLEGWEGPGPRRHHDFISVKDFPPSWLDLNLTVEVEAKAKEVAVLKLKNQLEQRRRGFLRSECRRMPQRVSRADAPARPGRRRVPPVHD